MKRSLYSPACYKYLSLRNFRGFKKLSEMPLAPLTFLVGPNSCGKSSLFNAFLFITHNNMLPMLDRDPTFNPSWMGPIIDLGSFNDTVFNHNDRLNIHIGVGVSLNPKGVMPKDLRAGDIMQFDFDIKTKGNNTIGYISKMNITDTRSNEQAYLKREPPPSPLLELKGYGTHLRIYKGSDGTYSAPYAYLASGIRNAVTGKKFRKTEQKASKNRISRHLNTQMYSNFLKGTQRVFSARSGPKRWYDPKSSQDFDRQVIDRVTPEMLEYIVEKGGKKVEQKLWKLLSNLSIASKISILRSKLHPQVIMVKDNITKIESNFMDIGFGASQVLPIIAACLVDRKGPVFIEQPEIHLHPKAQSVIADLLCETSHKRQVIVETHSAHMINRARIQVLKGNLDCRDVIVNFVYRNENGSHVKTIPILENGEFGAEWPEGFFDERFQDTKTLLKLRSKK